MPKVIAIGEILVEMMAKTTGQSFLEPGEWLGPYPSGAPAIFIDQAARLGADCGIIAKVGDDDFGRLNLDRLRSDGVDLSQAAIVPGATTGTAFVSYRPNGDRDFIFHFAHSAAGLLAPEDVSEDYVRQADYLHVMGCSLSASDSMRLAVMSAVDIVKANGGKVSFDPNLRPELRQVDGIRDVFQRILEASDIIMSGEEELLQLTGGNTTEEAVASVQSMGASIVALKRGSNGSTVYAPQGICHIPPFEVEEIDATGAGDCYDGAFIAQLAAGSHPFEAARLAAAAGAYSVTRQGPMEGAATRSELTQLLASGPRPITAVHRNETGGEGLCH